MAGLRDRALIGVIRYYFARIGAVLGMDAKDYVQHNWRCCGWLASALQMLGTKSIFLVALMSANTSTTMGSVESSGASFTVGMACCCF
jgi:hypothetical protein